MFCWNAGHVKASLSCPLRYAKLRDSSHSYVINQFGLSCFKAEGAAAYTASTFNFYIFPEPLKDAQQSQSRKFLSDSGSLSFLASQNFDFNKWIYKGIPFLPARERQRRIQDAVRAGQGDLVISRIITFISK